MLTQSIYRLSGINNSTRKLLVLTSCLLIFSMIPQAQSGTLGRLTGKITDSSTNQSLLGVSVIPKGTDKGVASINDGTYILALPAGIYTIRYSYSGYSTKEISEVIIKRGEATFMDIFLTPKKNELTNVVVTATARRAVQAAVYTKQRLSAAASDGISTELINKTPDNNAGQILKRVTGVSVQNDKFVVVRGLGAQYNQTMLNGVAMTSTETNQNAFSFDLVPAAVIDNIVVNKTATPDMPGNFAGGVVQVNTKDFPASDFFSIAVQAGFSDQTYNKDFYSDKRSNMEWLGFGGKSRDLPAGFPKASDRINFTTINDQERIRYLRTLKNNLVPANMGPSGLNENVQLGYGKTIRFGGRNQFGIVAAITQRKSELIEQETTTRDLAVTGINPDGTIIGNYNYFSNNTRYRYSSEMSAVLNLAYSFGSNKITFKNIYSQLLRNNFIKRDSVFYPDIYIAPGPTGVQGFSYLTEQRGLLNSVLAGEHKTGLNNETQLDWNINVTTNNTKLPDTRNFLLNSVDDKGNFSGRNDGVSVPSLMRTSSRIWSDSKDLITGAAFNLSTVFRIFDVKQILKGGVLVQNRRRQVTADVLPFKIASTFTPLDSILAPSQFYYNGTDLLIAPDIIEKAGNYNANTSLQASYVSIENKIKNSIRVIWGLRFENYQQSISVYKSLFYPSFREPELVPLQFASRSTFDFLPSVNIVYSPGKNMNIRAAYSKTVIRPDLKDLVANYSYDFQAFRFVTGNAELKSTSIANYDLKFEWFPTAGEIVSFGAFYKTMTDPIEYGENVAQNNFIGRLAINTGDATVKGIEFEVRKKLNFFPSAAWMQNITFFGNGTLLHSEVKERVIYNSYFSFSPAHALTGQPKYILNGGISISAFKNTFDATFSYNRTGDFINQLGSSDFVTGILPNDKLPNGTKLLQVPNFILEARDIIDISVRQSFLRGKALIKFNVANMLSKPLVIYQDLNGDNKLGKPVRIDTSPAGQGVITGGEDNIASMINGQRTYSFSFSYTF
jgi:outer membrane receptor protein involved in Fe transport